MNAKASNDVRESGDAQQFDVIIVGGGPAGASAAIRLASSGARVALIEQKKFPREKLCGEFISPECLAHFARLGVLDSMQGAGGTHLRETIFYAASGRAVAVPSAWFGRAAAVSSSSFNSDAAFSSFSHGIASASCALGLSRAEMDARLLARAREVGATIFEESHASGVVFDTARVGGVRVQTQGAELILRAPLTLDATGRTRALARQIEKTKRDVHQGTTRDGQRDARRDRRRGLVAFKAHLSGAGVAEGACEIYFYRGGYGGLNSVERGLSNLCFIVAARDVRALKSDPECVMREVVSSNRRAAETLHGARVESQWLAVALEGFGRFNVAPARGLLAVGDAASFIDPFTGSGMLMALESGELAAHVIALHLAELRMLAQQVSSRDALGDDFDVQGDGYDALAAEYRALYRERFGARLRVCSYLRRAAFAPGALVELGIAALGASEGVRRKLVRATRGVSAQARNGQAEPRRE